MNRINPFNVNIAIWLIWACYWLVASWFVQATKSSEGLLLRATHLLFLALGFFLIFHDADHSFAYGRLYDGTVVGWLGNLFTLFGLLFAVWGRVHLGRYWSGMITLKQGHKLIRTGPYRCVRHPLYTGFVTAVFASALMIGTIDAFLGLLIVVAAYLVKIRREETLLTNQFADEYPQFKQEVAALVPFIF